MTIPGFGVAFEAISCFQERAIDVNKKSGRKAGWGARYALDFNILEPSSVLYYTIGAFAILCVFLSVSGS